MTDLAGKTALITGSTSGIGKATAIALAARGAHVLVVGRNQQRAEHVLAEIEAGGGSATFRLTALADAASAQDLVDWATEAGHGHVDILVNNAGVALLGPTDTATEADFDETFGLNVKVPSSSWRPWRQRWPNAAGDPSSMSARWSPVSGRRAWRCTAPAGDS